MASSPSLDHDTRLDIRPSGKSLGAEIRGIDLRTLDDASFAALHRAWLDNQVLLIRDQSLSDADLIAFSRRLGDLDLAPIQETGRRFVEGLPELYIVSNVVKDGAPIGSLGNGEAVWHTDMSYVEVPPQASALYALEVPPTGGDTSFVNMYAVYDSLPADLKTRIAGLRVKHDGTYNSGGFLRQGVTPTDDPRTSPGTLHPLVYAHPETGRPRYISAAGATPMSTACRSTNPTRCSTNSGATSTETGSAGPMSGARAISSFGTIAARCTGAIRSIRRRDG